VGPEGSLAHLAQQRLVPDADAVAVDDARVLLRAVEAGDHDVGIVAYEDSVAGSDPQVVDHLVFESATLRVQAEVDLEVPDADPAATRRYVQIGRTATAAGRAPQTLLFVVPSFNRPGTLLDVLAAFSSRGINLTKIESRPLAGHLGMYGFLLEAEGAPADAAMVEALGDVLHASQALKSLGTFSAADRAWGQVRGRDPAGELLYDLGDLDALLAELA
jgi:prephenate dehydratase